jgi:hypothetical protein
MAAAGEGVELPVATAALMPPMVAAAAMAIAAMTIRGCRMVPRFYASMKVRIRGEQFAVSRWGRRAPRGKRWISLGYTARGYSRLRIRGRSVATTAGETLAIW